MKGKEYQYLTFPIQLLNNVYNEPRKAMENVFFYCFFSNCERVKGEDMSIKMRKAQAITGIRYKSPIEAYEIGKSLFESMPANVPKTSLKIDLINEFYTTDKTEFERVCFLAFAAIRSILQTKQYCKIDNEYLVSRMASNASKGEDLPEWIKPYNNRYQLDKIKKALQVDWRLNLYAKQMRGFIVSFKLNYEQLVRVGMKLNRKYKERQMQREKQLIEQRVKQSLLNSSYRKDEEERTAAIISMTKKSKETAARYQRTAQQ